MNGRIGATALSHVMVGYEHDQETAQHIESALAKARKPASVIPTNAVRFLCIRKSH